MQMGMRSKKDAQGIIITTADTDVNRPCYEMNLKAKRILNGQQTQDDFFCIIYSLDETDDYHNQDCWIKANPSLYAIIDPSVIQADIDDAELTPHKIPELKAKTFGIWGGGGEHSWMPIEVWEKNKKVIVDENELAEMDCTVALDMSQVNDLTVYTFDFKKGNKEYFLHRKFIPSDTLADRYRKDNANFPQWCDKGIITVIQGATIDYDFVFAKLPEDIDRFNPLALGYDKWQAKYIINKLEEARPNLLLIEIEQSLKKLSPMFKDYEKLIRDGNCIDNDEVMKWCVNNVIIKPDVNDNYIPLKSSKASTQRIDLVVSATMSHGLWLLPEVVDGGKVSISFERLKTLL